MLVHQVRGVRSPQRFHGDSNFVAATPITEAFQYNAWLQLKIRKSRIGPTSITQKYFEGQSSMQFIENLINDSMSKILKAVQGGHSVASVGSLDLSGMEERNRAPDNMATRSFNVQPPSSGNSTTFGTSGAFARLQNSVKKRLSPDATALNTDNGAQNGIIDVGQKPAVDTNDDANRRNNGRNSPRLILRFKRALSSSVRLYWRVLNAILTKKAKK